MGNKFMNKVWSMLGVAEDTDYDYGYEDEENQETPVEEKGFLSSAINKKNSKVVGMPGLQQVQVIISQPSTFEQSEEICDHLKEKKSIILNLEYVNKDVARRIVDFVGGAVFALDGTIQKISNSIFLVAPHNYEITNEVMKEDIKNKLSVSWIK
ncbi:MAG: cell division protein SepF [Clostridia bacterium]|nr:cell division protein SepF [Clostridia bacterium]